MKIDVLVAEIGSTTTIVNAFNGIENGNPVFLGQGEAATTVLDGDVRIGLSNAIQSLQKYLKTDSISYGKMLATSSAAGGLKMTVHGLVYDMTVRAAKEAALGAGAIVKMITAGKLRQSDIDQIKKVKPNLILLAGGTDYGERETALYNAKMLSDLEFDAPVLYAGNVQNQEEIKQIFQAKNRKCVCVENVYPQLDILNIEPTRKLIHKTFEENIVKAAGMEHIREMVSGHIIPTPGAVMEATLLLYDIIGDLITVDIGGATTDVHSVTDGSEEIASISLDAEPRAKRTVEGDLGMFVNARNVVELIGADKLGRKLGFDTSKLLDELSPIPQEPQQVKFVEELAYNAGKIALSRHSGHIRYVFGSNGRQPIAQGKDLTTIKYLVGTGGALTRLPNHREILRKLADININKTMLYPKPDTMEILVDNDYIMASLGVMSLTYKEAAEKLLKKSLGI
ncbi:MAG TPA: GlmL-related ornithine degradation protein [Clostridia bacterium]|nr:GlmL-related ornithine degradation protein [Clostridia bacterium]